MQVAVLPNYAVASPDDIRAVVLRLNRLGVTVCQPADTTAFPAADCDRLIADSDAVIAFGGDGTLIHVAKRAAPFHRAVLGINSGHLGFMAALEADRAVEGLEQLVSGQYTVDTRMLLEVSLHTETGDRVFHALNEAVISRGSLSRMIGLSVEADGRSVITYRADGAIVSTPTGSTAYSLSAGGPVIDPQMDCLLLTPICPHSLHTRSYIFADTAELTVRPHGEPREMFLTVDGEESVPIQPQDTVTVKRSPLAARMIRLQPVPFYEVLNQKLLDR